MFLSNGSIARPVAMSCLAIALTLLGSSAYFNLGLELFPKMDIVAAIVLTYLVLAASLESFTRPFYIMLTVPLALIGMLWALRITGIAIDSLVMLGGVMLIGIVVNAAVLVIDHTAQLIKRGRNPGDAMVQAVVLEFRPIVMITVAAAFGMLPLAFSSGLGSELTTGIGTSSVGGIVVSGMLTLFVIPIAFLLFNPPKEDFALPEKEDRSAP